MKKEKKEILRLVLEGYKQNKLSDIDVYLLLSEFGIMRFGALKVDHISASDIARLNKNTAIIIKGE